MLAVVRHRVRRDGDGGGRFGSAEALAKHVAHAWRGGHTGQKLVVCTGGEPLLQLDEALCADLHEHGFEVAIETNGTLPVPRGVDWICVSPKAGGELVVRAGHELKLVIPQEGIDPADLEHLAFDNLYLQPRDDLARAAHTRLAIEYCLSHPRWRLSVQTHKVLGIP